MWDNQESYKLPPLEYIMTYPKIKNAYAIDDHTLLVEFDNNQRKKYDTRPLLEKEMFNPLKNPAFLKQYK